MALSPTSSHGGGASSSLAIVHRSAAIAGWLGTTLPFDVVTVDSDGLWDAANFQFVAKVSGSYELSAYATSLSPAGVSFTASGTINAVYFVAAVVFGAGDNVGIGASEHTQVTSGTWIFPPLHGYTQLDAADAVVIQGTSGLDVPLGFTFAIRGPL